MKIVITTAIYPPEIGGPSFYAKNLKEALEYAGHTVDVVLYGSLKRFPSVIRHVLYALRVWRVARRADSVIVLDTFSTAVPVGLITPFLNIPVLCRVGGDFVWEHYTERTHEPLPLPQTYENKHKWNLKEKIAYWFIRFSLRSMTVVFSSEWQAELWKEPYQLDEKRIRIITNAIPARVASSRFTRKNFLFFGRPLFLKNADAFRRAFQKAKEQVPDIELEEGMMPKEELQMRLTEGYAVVLPSISDVTPNIILESIQHGKPFLITKYSGYAKLYKDLGIVVDPLSEADMTRGIIELANEAIYQRLAGNIAAFTTVRTYDDIAKEFVTLIESL